MDIYKCGTKVKLLLANCDGIITEVRVRDEVAWYSIASYINGDLSESLYSVHEFTADDINKVEIGFK